MVLQNANDRKVSIASLSKVVVGAVKPFAIGTVIG